MSRQRVVLLFAVAAGVALSALPSVFAAEFRVVKPDEIKYLPNERGSGPDIAVIHGDPQKAEFYIIRARFEPGVMSQPHSHPSDRHVTVISGTWWAGKGKTFDPSQDDAARRRQLHAASRRRGALRRREGRRGDRRDQRNGTGADRCRCR